MSKRMFLHASSHRDLCSISTSVQPCLMLHVVNNAASLDPKRRNSMIISFEKSNRSVLPTLSGFFSINRRLWLIFES
jgi:hypothetical protein